MNELPILFMSKETDGREGIVEATIYNLFTHLKTKRELVFYGAIAGSGIYFDKIESILNSFNFKNKLYEFTNTRAGFAWNMVVNGIFNDGYDKYFRFEDDFKLKEDFNIDTYIELLETNDKVGMVRLGLMPINLNLRSVGWYDKDNQGHIFFDCLPTSPYAYSGNPGLIHKRMHDQVGYFHETHNPGDIEIDFDSRVRQNMVNGGCRIWYPLELGKYGTYGAFSHIGDVKSY